LSNTILPTKKTVKKILQAVHQRCCFRVPKNKIITLLFLLPIALCGCKDRRVTTPTPQMDIESQFWIRVLLFKDINNCRLEFSSAFDVTNEHSNPQKQNSSVHFDRMDSPVNVRSSPEGFNIAGRTFTDEQIIITPSEPHIFNINGSEYRGKLKLITNSETGYFYAINMIPIESYLAGVTGAEMPDYWEPEALKAQVIAARTYCLYTKKRFGNNRNWDVGKTAAHQVYHGLSVESASIWDAVNQTTGRILVCKQADGTEDIFPAYYSSTCGGHTENSKNVFGESFKPLTGVPCPYCKDVAKPKFFFWPMVRFDKTTVKDKLFQRYEKLRQLGDITDITIADKTDYDDFSRLTMIKLHGPTGSDFLRAEDFRLAIDSTGRKIRSASFKLVNLEDSWAFLEGRGWGHSVGMCQCGAQGMARQGKTAKQILLHYYPGAKISTIDY
jgi:stage II sporulation protein D